MSENKSHTREELLEKISSALFGDDNSASTEKGVSKSINMQKVASLTMTASKMLKYAAEETKKMKVQMEKLADENQKLASELLIREKKERGTELAALMNDKKMIKKADIPAQAQKIAELDDEAFEMFKTAVENISVKSEKVGLDNLTFLDGTYNINNIRDNRKTTLADSIEDAINEKS